MQSSKCCAKEFVFCVCGRGETSKGFKLGNNGWHFVLEMARGRYRYERQENQLRWMVII